jgi:aspartate/methionine/tyrosine aminotransferase
MESIPIPANIIKETASANGLPEPGLASIREIASLVNLVEKETGIKFVRMEMGVPGLKTPPRGIEAEIEALRNGVSAIYPDISGLPSLKTEISRFIKLFLDVDINPEGCIPTVGSMMGAMICFLVANRNDKTKEGTLFLDPGFPVHKQQVKMIGHDYYSFDVYGFRGRKLKRKLESYLETGKISSMLYSNPNNPAWICFNEEELMIIGELAAKYDVIVIEDLAYFGMDFRKDYSRPGEKPFQPTVARYTKDYTLLISTSKIFSYAGQRIGIMAISDHLFHRSYPDLLRYYSTSEYGHSAIFGALYAISAGVSHSAQYGLRALLKSVNDGRYNFRDDVHEYADKARVIKKMFVDNGFVIVYDKDIDEMISDGFYFTVAYQGMSGKELINELLCYGISAITLDSTGSERQGLRVCVSLVPREQFSDLGERLCKFNEDHNISLR